MPLDVIGAGFGRTGTSSLQAALEQLGFDRCYHMREVFANPHHAGIWIDAFKGRPVDWEALFAGYRATVDWPGCTFYRELMHQYPEAKILLSVRDPEKWYDSARTTIYASKGSTRIVQAMRVLLPRLRKMTGMVNTLVWQGTFHGRFEDRQYAIDTFNWHNQEVMRLVPPDRLLVYDVKQGWEPLCQFLGVPVPQDTPFPHLNDGAEFRAMIQQRAQNFSRMVSAVVGGIALLALGAIVWARRRR